MAIRPKCLFTIISTNTII